MGIIGLLILAAIPHVGNPWAVSALIFVGGGMVLFRVTNNQQFIVKLLVTVAENQKKIYDKLAN